jgi:hypothetical protein
MPATSADRRDAAALKTMQLELENDRLSDEVEHNSSNCFEIRVRD